MAYNTTPEGDDFLETARTRFRKCSEAESELRTKMTEDLEFYRGDGQWPEGVKRQRRQKRPCLTINRLPQFVHQVTNEVRQNKPAPDVSPVDDAGDKETAEIMQGIIRHIERLSKGALGASLPSFS